MYFDLKKKKFGSVNKAIAVFNQWLEEGVNDVELSKSVRTQWRTKLPEDIINLWEEAVHGVIISLTLYDTPSFHAYGY